jgi:hypothetical protein
VLKLLAALATLIVLVAIGFVPVSDNLCGKAVWAIEVGFDLDHQAKVRSCCFAIYRQM